MVYKLSVDAKQTLTIRLEPQANRFPTEMKDLEFLKNNSELPDDLFQIAAAMASSGLTPDARRANVQWNRQLANLFTQLKSREATDGNLETFCRYLNANHQTLTTLLTHSANRNRHHLFPKPSPSETDSNDS